MAWSIVVLSFTLILCICISYEIFRSPGKETVITFRFTPTMPSDQQALETATDAPSSTSQAREPASLPPTGTEAIDSSKEVSS